MLLNRAKAEQLMAEQDLDVLVLAYTENVMYFSDFLRVRSNRMKSRLSYVVFFRDGSLEPAMLTPHQDYLDTCQSTWIRDVRKTAEYEIPGQTDVAFDKPALVAEIIAERGLTSGRVGYEEQSLPVERYRELSAALTGFELVPATRLLQRLRATKSAEELKIIRKAMDLTELAARTILREARPGVTEAELADMASEAAISAGATGMAFVIIGANEHGAFVHGVPRDYRLQEGDIVRFDVGASIGVLGGDLARTFVVGDKVADEHAHYYSAVKAAVDAGIAAVKPGATAGEVYAAQVKAGQAIDPGLHREHSGHGLGFEVHEEPMVRMNNDFVLEPGMLVMVENSRYLPGKGGYQLEDLVLVTEDGHEVLTSVPRDLIVDRGSLS